MAGIILSAVPLSVMAAPADIQAAQARTVTFHLPAQDLNAALLTFARQADLQLVYDVALVQGRKSAALDGDMTPEAGLSRLLSGSGLTYRFVDSHTIALERVASDATTLAPVTVEGAQTQTQESAYGPVSGYVAKHSATATKTDTPILETPRSVSVVTNEELTERQPTSIADALGYVAGVTGASRGGDTRYDWFTIRGFDSSSSLFRDGLQAQGSDGKIEPYALERIEVLKGPASILYGQVAPGGIINAVTKRADAQENFGEAEADLGSNNLRAGRADLNAALNDDKTLAARMVLVKQESDTSVKYTPDNRDYAMLTLAWTPDADTTLNVMGDYRHDETAFPAMLPAEGTAWASRYGTIARDFFAGAPDAESLKRDQYSIGYNLEHSFNSHVSFTQNARISISDTPDFFGVRTSDLNADGRTMSRYTFAGKVYRNTDEVDNQMHLKGDTGMVSHHLIVGVDYSQDRYVFNYGMGTASDIDLYDPDYNQSYVKPAIDSGSTTLTKQTGLYAQDQAKIGDHWTLTLGARQDFATVKTLDMSGTDSRQDDHATTWNTGLVYLFDNGLAPYASYATSFLPNSGTDSAGASFHATTAKQSEMGVKFQPPGSESMSTLSAFDLIEDHVLTADPDNSSFEVDAGQWESKGVELENRIALGYGFRLITAATVMDVRITKSNDGNQGHHPAGVPNHTASAWLDYEVKTGEMKGLGMGVGERYVGKRPVDSSSDGTAPAYMVTDLALRYQLDSLGFSLAANNVFDKAYVQCRDATDCAWGQGRSVIGTVKYRW